MERYQKQILFTKIGLEGQKILLQKRVLIIGSGALGSVIANNLTRSGLGFIRIIDPDIIETSNLQRQILFDEEDVKDKLPKAVAAENRLRKINSSIHIEGIVDKVDYKNIEEYCKDIDLIVDGTDNFKIRYLINDTAIKLNIPWVYGGVIGCTGMVHTTIPYKTPCLRCIFSEEPEIGTYPTCHTEGVLNSITSVVASIESTQALKILLGSTDNIISGLQTIDIWNNEFELIEFSRDENCNICGGGI